MSYLRLNGLDRELLSTRLANLMRGSRRHVAEPTELELARAAERRSTVERIKRRNRGNG